jgi:hypothetical protein
MRSFRKYVYYLGNMKKRYQKRVRSILSRNVSKLRVYREGTTSVVAGSRALSKLHAQGFSATSSVVPIGTLNAER